MFFLKNDSRPKEQTKLIKFAKLALRSGNAEKALSWFKIAFKEFPESEAGNRYSAACAAALEGSKIARKLALSWLRIEFEMVNKNCESGENSRRDASLSLADWMQTRYLVDVRSDIYLKTLSESEATEWRDFWNQVEEFINNNN